MVYITPITKTKCQFQPDHLNGEHGLIFSSCNEYANFLIRYSGVMVEYYYCRNHTFEAYEQENVIPQWMRKEKGGENNENM